MWHETLQLSRSDGEQKFRILSANISTWIPHSEGFCAVLRWDRSTNTATRNPVALAAWSMEKSDVGGRSGFDWGARLVRLGGSMVLFGLSQAKTWSECGSSSTSSGAVICRSFAWETGIRLHKKWKN